MKIKQQRDNKQNKLNADLLKNRNEQDRLRERLRQLMQEDKLLTTNIDQNNALQAQADKV